MTTRHLSDEVHPPTPTRTPTACGESLQAELAAAHCSGCVDMTAPTAHALPSSSSYAAHPLPSSPPTLRCRSGPTTVLVLSLLFIAFVVLLHIWGKFRKG